MPALNTDEFMEGKTVEYVKLANGVEIPKIGYGVFQISKDDAPRCVREAIETGYRHIDTAQSYFNEAEVGQGIKDSGIDRKDLVLTTKIWISNYGYENTLRSVDVSLKKLGTDYFDLVLLHQPFSDTYGAWRALEKLYKDGVIRAIGVSNFYPDRLADMVAFNEIAPMSIRSRLIRSTSRSKLARTWSSGAWLRKHGLRSGRACRTCSPIPPWPRLARYMASPSRR